MTDELPAAARVITSGDVPEPPAGGSAERHSAARYFWTWLVTPHIEFGAIYVGMVVVLFLDMSLVQALIGIVLGVGFGALSHAILTATGVRLRIPPIALGKRAFGERGNRIPATLMAIVSSVGWFIFNSLFAALALNALFGLPNLWALAIVVVLQLLLAQFPVNHKALRRYLFPVVTLVFVVSGIFAATAIKPGADPGSQWNLNGIIAIIVVACMAWAYTIGWSPYATDYSGVVPKDVSPRAAGVGAALGLFVATTFFMMVGVVAAIAFEGHVDKVTNPTEQFASILPNWLGVIALV